MNIHAFGTGRASGSRGRVAARAAGRLPRRWGVRLVLLTAAAAAAPGCGAVDGPNHRAGPASGPAGTAMAHRPKASRPAPAADPVKRPDAVAAARPAAPKVVMAEPPTPGKAVENLFEPDVRPAAPTAPVPAPAQSPAVAEPEQKKTVASAAQTSKPDVAEPPPAPSAPAVAEEVEPEVVPEVPPATADRAVPPAAERGPAERSPAEQARTEPSRTAAAGEVDPGSASAAPYTPAPSPVVVDRAAEEKKQQQKPEPEPVADRAVPPAPVASPASESLAPTPTPTPAPPQPPERPLSPEQAKVRAKLAGLKAQLDNGTDVNEKDDRGRTLLQQAAIAGELQTVEMLLDGGANVRAVDRQGWTALHWAASGGHQEICELLIASVPAAEARGFVDARGFLDDTPLYWAAVFDRRDTIELLLARGAAVNATDKRGRTPLHAAIENDARGSAAVLLAKGADVGVRDEAGLTPLHQAILRTRKALVELAGGAADADPTGGVAASAVVASPASARNGGGQRQAILTGGREAVRMLLDKGADAGAATPRGVTPLHLAAWDDTRDLAELLVSAGADPAAKDSRDRTAADYAKQRGQKGVLKVLAKKAR